MQFSVKSAQQPEKQRSGCIIFSQTGNQRLYKTLERMDSHTQGALSQFLRKGDISSQFGHLGLLHQIKGIVADRLLVIGQGPNGAPLTDTQFRQLMTKLALFLFQSNITDASIWLADFEVQGQSSGWKIRQVMECFHHAFYTFDLFKSQKDTSKPALKHFTFLLELRKELKESEKALNEAIAIAHGMELAKNLANTPPNICNPHFLADKAKQLAKKYNKLSVAILDEKDIIALKMGLFQSVMQGSQSSAKLITLEYRGAPKSQKPIVLIGKGITFDTGGNTIKVPPNMIGQKYDMTGGAIVFGVLQAAILLELPLNLIGVIPSCENMPGPSATRPEDIVTSLSGLTVEILNTDAEGRLILADALTYAERFHPDTVIDIATLTGACALALGQHASGLMSNHEPLTQALLKAGEYACDRAWPLPLWEAYHEALKSDFADIANVPFADVGARTIIAGCFLAKFAKNFHWAHLDVANTATKTAPSPRGATGRPLPLLVQYLLDRCHQTR